MVVDSEDSCGICGKSLVGTPSLETSIEEEELKEQKEERRREQVLVQETAKRTKRRTKTGLAGGIGILMVGAGLIFFGRFGNPGMFISGFLLLPLGALVLASVVLGGLGRGLRGGISGPPAARGGRMIIISKEINRDILNPEEIREDDKVREERKKDEFD